MCQCIALIFIATRCPLCPFIWNLGISWSLILTNTFYMIAIIDYDNTSSCTSISRVY